MFLWYSGIARWIDSKNQTAPTSIGAFLLCPFKNILIVIAVLLFLIWIELRQIASRAREHFPTDKERDHDFARRDPMGHWEAHKDDKDR